MVLQGFKDYGFNSQGFRMVADSGEIVMLAPKYAAELKNDERVDFVKLFLQVWDVHDPVEARYSFRAQSRC